MITLPVDQKARRLADRRARDARRGRLGPGRYDALVNRLAAFMRQEWEEGRTPTKLNHEGTARTSLRASLCLQGWRWRDADDMAAEIVAAALLRIGGKRPTWLDGQPAFYQDGASVLRERCLCCGAALVGEIGVSFCSRGCKVRWSMKMRAKAEGDMERAARAI